MTADHEIETCLQGIWDKEASAIALERGVHPTLLEFINEAIRQDTGEAIARLREGDEPAASALICRVGDWISEVEDVDPDMIEAIWERCVQVSQRPHALG